MLEFDRWVGALERRHPWLPSSLARRWARAYGSRAEILLAGAAGIDDLGEEVAPRLYAAELRYLMRHEWAGCAEDVLWRRSKLGLHLPPGCADDVDAWMDAARAGEGTAPLVEPA